MKFDQKAMQAVLAERLGILGSPGATDEESDGEVPEFFKIPGLRKTQDSTGAHGGGGEKWEGTRDSRKVKVWRGTKWFKLTSEVSVSGPFPPVDVKGRRGKWEGDQQGNARAVLAANPPGPGSVRLRCGPDGAHIRRRMATREFYIPGGSSMQWADLILAERLAENHPTARPPDGGPAPRAHDGTANHPGVAPGGSGSDAEPGPEEASRGGS